MSFASSLVTVSGLRLMKQLRSQTWLVITESFTATKSSLLKVTSHFHHNPPARSGHMIHSTTGGRGCIILPVVRDWKLEILGKQHYRLAHAGQQIFNSLYFACAKYTQLFPKEVRPKVPFCHCIKRKAWAFWVHYSRLHIKLQCEFSCSGY